MRKLHILGLWLVLAVAFSTAGASTASAETTLLGEWFVGGTRFSGTLPTENNNKIIFEDTSFSVSVECTDTIVGSVTGESSGVGEATEILTASKVKTGTPLSGTALECGKKSGCENSAKVWPLRLPWSTVVYLLENGDFWEQFASESVDFEVECTVLLTKTSDECGFGSSGTSVEILNIAIGVEGTEEALLPLMNCSLGGSGSGVITPLKGNTTTVSGGVLSVSSE
jgi:hypothetical protein